MYSLMYFAHHRGIDNAENWTKKIKTLCPLLLCGEDRLGFTLVEILIAIFIFAMVLSIIYTSYTGSFRIIDETEYQTDIYSMARISLERMLEDLESAYVPPPLKSSEPEEENRQVLRFVSEDRAINGSSADSLLFTSKAHLVFREQRQASATAEISYDVAENEQEDGLVLYRKDKVVAAGVEETSGEGSNDRLVLCEKLASVDFTFYDAEGEVYNEWDSTTEDVEGRIPRMIAITLEFINKSDTERPFKFLTRVALPMIQRPGDSSDKAHS